MFKPKRKFHYFRVIITAVIITVLLRLFVFEKFYIYSVSMLPTLDHKEWVWVTKYNYGYSRFSFPFMVPIAVGERLLGKAPQRGDVVVFKSTYQRDRWPYVKRVIGLPGDKIALQNGRLYINGQKILRKFVEDVEYMDSFGHLRRYKLYVEILTNGKKYQIFEINDEKSLDDIPEVIIPDGYYFFVGDNRDESEDSRGDLGLIPFENLIGKVKLRD